MMPEEQTIWRTEGRPGETLPARTRSGDRVISKDGPLPEGICWAGDLPKQPKESDKASLPA